MFIGEFKMIKARQIIIIVSLLELCFLVTLVYAQTVPSVAMNSSTVPVQQYFYENANNWRILLGPSAETSTLAHYWPKGSTGDYDTTTPRMFCFAPLSLPTPAN